MSAICTVPECARETRCKGLCTTHYNNSLAGRPLKAIGTPSVEQAFRDRFQMTEPAVCWPWQGALSRNGYGHFGNRRRRFLAHRLAWELANGQPIPAGMIIDHRCHNRACVNPAHLQLADKQTNGENRAGADVDSKSGVRGVSWDKRNKSWVVYAASNGKTYNGGRYKNLDEAKLAAMRLRNRIHTNNLTDRGIA